MQTQHWAVDVIKEINALLDKKRYWVASRHLIDAIGAIEARDVEDLQRLRKAAGDAPCEGGARP